MTTLLAFAGRLLIALLFIVSGANKLMDIPGTSQMIASVGLPPILALPTALFELIAGLALVFGFLTRLFALLLAGFCLLTAFFFHNQFTDPDQATMLLKNLAVAGGLLCLTGLDTARWSYDAIRTRRRADLAARDAELRAARAEGAASAARTAPHGTVTDGHTVVTDVNGDGVPETRSKRRWF